MIVEDGNYVPTANSYASLAYADQYFTDRPSATWNDVALTDAQKSAALIAATDYIEKKFSHRFLGQKEFTAEDQARNVLTFHALTAVEITIGSTVISIDAAADIDLQNSFSDLTSEFMNYLNNLEIGVTAELGIDTSVIIVSDDSGPDGNTISCSTDEVTRASFALTTLLGGSTVTRPQRLSFPRKYLVDRHGTAIYGVPDQLKMATCEYAVRSLSAALLPDPTLSENGQPVSRVFEKIGPIETETAYVTTLSNLLQSYPAADRLLMDFLGPTGGVIR